MFVERGAAHPTRIATSLPRPHHRQRGRAHSEGERAGVGAPPPLDLVRAIGGVGLLRARSKECQEAAAAATNGSTGRTVGKHGAPAA
jgi:hypothetical protein